MAEEQPKKKRRGILGMFKDMASKAEDTVDQTKKDVNETAVKMQETLDTSSRGVQVIVEGILIALGVSIIGNLIAIGLNIHAHKRGRHQIVIHNLYLGGPK